MPSSGEESLAIVRRKRRVVGFIEDERKRRVTLCKRKDGLFRKLKMLCEEHPGTEAAAVVVSESGVAYTFEYPLDASVFHRLLTATGRGAPSGLGAVEGTLGELERLEVVVRALKERLEGG